MKDVVADPHVLGLQNSKGPLCLAHAASLQGGLLQDPAFRFVTARGEDKAVRSICFGRRFDAVMSSSSPVGAMPIRKQDS